MKKKDELAIVVAALQKKVDELEEIVRIMVQSQNDLASIVTGLPAEVEFEIDPDFEEQINKKKGTH